MPVSDRSQVPTRLLKLDPRGRIIASPRAPRALLLVACLLWVMQPRHAEAQPPDTKVATVTVGSVAPTGAAPDKVYPPLPSLSMLPPTTDADDDDTPKRKSASRKKGAAAKVKNDMPTPRLVVSDETRTYLNSVDQDIDRAMPK
jgi:hypothetical protein